jgi:hypothetical protein
MLLRKSITIFLLLGFGLVTGHDIIPHSHERVHRHHHHDKVTHKHHHHDHDEEQSQSDDEESGLLGYLLSYIGHAAPSSVAALTKTTIVDIKKQSGLDKLFLTKPTHFNAIAATSAKAPPDIGVHLGSDPIYFLLSLRAPPALI